MLARRAKLVHDEWECDLPLLVPSFSSKGSGETKHEKTKRIESHVAGDLRDFGHHGTKSVLVSAYDLHFRHLDLTDETEYTESALQSLKRAEVVFLDSGGYELSRAFDSCEPKMTRHIVHRGYDESSYRGVIDRLLGEPNFPPLVLASFDHATKGKPFKVQVQAAKRLFADYDRVIRSFILKPWKPKGTVVEPDRLSERDIGGLRAFDIVGVTEKELGADLQVRLRKISSLRRKLDEACVDVPLHIWGGLDPVITPLYFFAGASVFDGVSWLRYGYYSGVAVSSESYQVLADGLGVGQKRPFVRGFMTLGNRAALDKLSVALQAWVDLEGKEFDMFELPIRGALEKAYKQMTTEGIGV